MSWRCVWKLYILKLLNWSSKWLLFRLAYPAFSVWHGVFFIKMKWMLQWKLRLRVCCISPKSYLDCVLVTIILPLGKLLWSYYEDLLHNHICEQFLSSDVTANISILECMYLMNLFQSTIMLCFQLVQESSMCSKTPPDYVIPHQPTNITLDAGNSVTYEIHSFLNDSCCFRKDRSNSFSDVRFYTPSTSAYG